MDFESLIPLGPFLMKGGSESIGFWLLAPAVSEQSNLEIQIYDSLEKRSCSVRMKKLASSEYGVWLGETDNILTASSSYRYQIVLDGNLYMPPGFQKSDLIFKTLPTGDQKQQIEFALISCNGIEEYEKHHKRDPSKNAWAMWERLLNEVQNNSNIFFSILGGDQVYMDEMFEEDKDSLEKEKPEDVKKRILEVYTKYWSNLAYRKIMARLPSILMWDDHDLIDGFGSRPDQFDKKGNENPGWSLYRKYLTKAFYEFQACRNPDGNLNPDGPFSFTYKVGSRGFVVLDLRTERNAIKGEMLSQRQKEKVSAEIKSLLDKKVDTILFVSPVTVTRMGGKVEEIIGKVSNYLWRVSSNLGHNTNILKPIVWWIFAAICFTIVQMAFNGKYGYPSVVGLFVLCLLSLLFDIFNGKNYLPKNIHNWVRGFNISLCVSLTGYMVWFWDWTNISFIPLLTNIREELVRSLIYDVEALVPSFFSIFFLYLSTQEKRFSPVLTKIFKWFALASLMLAVIAFVWIGMPGENSNIAMWIRLLPMFLLQSFGFVFYLISMAEASGAIDVVAGLDDDVKDAWSSDVNIKELQWFRGLCKTIQESGVKVVVLSGDIHTGGVSKLSLDKEFSHEKDFIYQIVSSPISYIPMEYIVEKLTSGNSITSIPPAGECFYAYNLFYRCERNFAVVKMDGKSDKMEANLFFEDVLPPEKIGC